VADEKRAVWRWIVVCARMRILFYLVAGLVAVDLLVYSQRHVWRAYDPDEYRDKIQACRSQARDLVVLGGSPVCEGINPAFLTGLPWRGGVLERVYNLGLPGATMSETWHAVEHGLAAPPRLLVYGITASDLNDARDEPHGPRVLMGVRDVTCWVRVRPHSAEWCVRQYVYGRLTAVWQLYAYRNAIRLWAADQVERVWPGFCPQALAEAHDGLRMSTALRDDHGFSPRPHLRDSRFDHLKAAGTPFERFHFLDNYRLGGHLAYLHRLIDWSQSRGVALILVDMPVSADLECRLHPEAFARYRSALSDLERTRNVAILRASRDAVRLGDADFADLIHLNKQGAAHLGAWLRNELSALGRQTSQETRATLPSRDLPNAQE